MGSFRGAPRSRTYTLDALSLDRNISRVTRRPTHDISPPAAVPFQPHSRSRGTNCHVRSLPQSSDRSPPHVLRVWRWQPSIALTVLIGKDWSLEARQAVFGQRQIQFYVPYSGSSPVYLPPVLLVAHNAGNQEETGAARD